MTRLHVVATVPLDRCGRPGGRLGYFTCCTALRYMFPHQLQLKRTGDPEGPRERLTSLGEVEALGHRVQMRPAARRPMSGIRAD
jgi:hypothetical protein